MQKPDKMLIAIVAGLLGLVAIAFVVLLTRPKPSYLPDGTPGAAVSNYLLALQTGDDTRAYSYVSPKANGYPRSLATFQRAIHNNGPDFSALRTAVVQVTETSISADGHTAYVYVAVHYPNLGGAFATTNYETTDNMTLELDPNTGVWQIVNATTFWAYCWSYSEGC